MNQNTFDSLPPSERRRWIIDRWQLQEPEAARALASANALDNLSRATKLMDRHLRPGRIPAVVRRSAPGLEGASLLDLALAGQHREVREAVEKMFRLPNR